MTCYCENCGFVFEPINKIEEPRFMQRFCLDCLPKPQEPDGPPECVGVQTMQSGCYDGHAILEALRC
jgi:hypothetical protein